MASHNSSKGKQRSARQITLVTLPKFTGKYKNPQNLKVGTGLIKCRADT